MNIQQHLKDSTRRQIAIEWMARESSKKILHMPYFLIVHQLGAWRLKDDEVAVRMFWDSFEAIIGGVMLKPAVKRLTASNYTWQKELVKLRDLHLFARLDQLEELPNQVDLAAIQDYLIANPAELARQKTIARQFNRNKQAGLPVLRRKEGKVWVDDGNRRCLFALLSDKAELEAWVCDTHDEKPRDYWVPTSELIGLVRLSTDHPQLVEEVRTILGIYFQESSVAKNNFISRVLGSTRNAEVVAEGLV